MEENNTRGSENKRPAVSFLSRRLTRLESKRIKGREQTRDYGRGNGKETTCGRGA